MISIEKAKRMSIQLPPDFDLVGLVRNMQILDRLADSEDDQNPWLDARNHLYYALEHIEEGLQEELEND